jgi:hypothetical protein
LIDFAFLAEKFETGPFWTVHNSLKTNADKIDFHSFWGEVFERYRNDALKSASDNAVNAVHDSPDFEDESKGQLCDAAIVCDTSAVFIEMKGATFSSRAKYDSDYHGLMSEVDAKLVQERDGSAKAVYQLKRAVELAFDRSASGKVNGLDLRLIDRLYPLVVTRDDIGSVFAMNGYLQVKFWAALNDTDVTVRVIPMFA